MTATNDGSFTWTTPLTRSTTWARTTSGCCIPSATATIWNPPRADAAEWMDWQLKGKGRGLAETPGIAIVSRRCTLIRATPRPASQIAEVHIYYAVN